MKFAFPRKVWHRIADAAANDVIDRPPLVANQNNKKKGNKTGFLLGFYRVSIDLTGLEWVQTGFLPYWTRFEQVFTEFYWV